MNTKRHPRTLTVRDTRQRKALASPLRLEILGSFTDRESLPVAEIAARMGRPPTAVYYHVHKLEEVGLLVRDGSRPGPKRDEILYRPVADQFDLTPARGDDDQVADALAGFTAAQRMAAGDLREALRGHDARFEGDDRNLLAFRLHARLTPARLAKANALLDELLAVFQEAPVAPAGAEDEFCSLNVALLPLRGRQPKG